MLYASPLHIWVSRRSFVVNADTEVPEVYLIFDET